MPNRLFIGLLLLWVFCLPYAEGFANVPDRRSPKRTARVAAKPKPAPKRRVSHKEKRADAKKTATKARAAKKAVVKSAPRRPLDGTVFYLASGHGGPDPGALGKYGRYLLPEDEYAYDVTVRLAQLLKQQGATVFMMVQDLNDGIRNDAVLKLDRDEVAYPRQPIPLNQTARLNQTTTAVNRLYARHKAAYQRFITIHVDSRSQGEKIDVFFYHHSGNKAGKQLAKHIHKRFKANYKRYQPDRPYSGNVTTRNTLYVVRNSHPPTVFIELGNIQNPLDQRRFLLASNRLALANWMMQGIVDDYQAR
ncbi:N-acetylmuramoyl-L-alanine amidase [Fibrella sp. WM1]|uniref:N-acetylmuramoyl-L-alanine amidase family protein n=1 Tax=Fibrella musci TaxID=3242485 RepID=UPI003521299B